MLQPRISWLTVARRYSLNSGTGLVLADVTSARVTHDTSVNSNRRLSWSSMKRRSSNRRAGSWSCCRWIRLCNCKSVRAILILTYLNRKFKFKNLRFALKHWRIESKDLKSKIVEFAFKHLNLNSTLNNLFYLLSVSKFVWNTNPVPTMEGGWVLVGWGCVCACVEVRSELSNRFKYVLLPSMLTNPWPSIAEVRITSAFPPFTGTLTPSPDHEGRENYNYWWLGFCVNKRCQCLPEPPPPGPWIAETVTSKISPRGGCLGGA